jgi:NADH-quinone oxidoreductase subunit L
MAYHWYVIRPSWKERLARSSIGRSIAKVLRSGWAADEMYSMVIVTPYRTITHWLRHDPVDDGLDMLAGSVRLSHYLLVLSQNGRIRTYAAGMVIGASLLFLSWLWS